MYNCIMLNNYYAPVEHTGYPVRGGTFYFNTLEEAMERIEFELKDRTVCYVVLTNKNSKEVRVYRDE